MGLVSKNRIQLSLDPAQLRLSKQTKGKSQYMLLHRFQRVSICVVLAKAKTKTQTFIHMQWLLGPCGIKRQRDQSAWFTPQCGPHCGGLFS